MAESLVPVVFQGATLLAVLLNGIPHVSIRSICEALGLDFQSQRHRMKRHPVLASTVVVTTTVAADGKERDTITLPLSMLNGWLFGVSAARVRPELRERLVQYQRECFDVLAAHFNVTTALTMTTTTAPRRVRRWLMASDGLDEPSFLELPDDMQIISASDIAEQAHQARIAELRRQVAAQEKQAQDHRNTLFAYEKFNRPGYRTKWLSHIASAAKADWYAEDFRDQLRALGVEVPAQLAAPAERVA